MNQLIWFRQDLRLEDNLALTLACKRASEHGSILYGVYIASPSQWRQHDVAPIQIDFIERHLNQLRKGLAKLNIALHLLHIDQYSNIGQGLADFCLDKGINQVYGSSDPEWNEQLRDKLALTALNNNGIEFQIVEQHCLLPCFSVLNGAQEMYRVFTPFSRRWRELANTREILCLPIPEPVIANCSKANCFKVSNDKWQQEINASDTQFEGRVLVIEAEKLDSRAWLVDSYGLRQHLQAFIANKVAEYDLHRDFPAKLATSGLSPYLAIGAISPRQCVSALLSYYPDVLVEESSPGRVWLNELIWREFYRHLLVAFPKLCRNQNFKAKADGIVWRNNPDEFQAWCSGQTGYPIIDAAMRQLNQTGWMHNRLRMLTASFMTKHLLIDWRWGEAYFKRHLIDGDLAANNGGWQWSAGTGCDAQPYFRIFNPITQGKKFDPDGEFIRCFVPELKHMQGKDLFEAKEVERYCPELKQFYPKAIVEHSYARKRALEALSVMKALSVNSCHSS